MLAQTSPELTIVIPAFNEAETIGAVLEGLKEQQGAQQWEIIVVDDGSEDGTGHIAQEQGARVLTHRNNRGYGAAIKTGIRAAEAAWVLTFDGDGQHRPEDVVTLFAQREGQDLVVGNRQGLLHSNLWRMPGKWLLGALANFLCERKIPDLNSGLRLFRKEVISRYLHLCADGFSFSTTSTLISFNRGHGVHYVPIEVRPRTTKSTVTVGTGFAAFALLFRMIMLFHPLRIFTPVAVLFFLGGIGWGLQYILDGKGLSVAALLMLLTGIHLFFVGLLADQIAEQRKEKFE